MGAETVQTRVERYLGHGQIWARQTSSLVGDATWDQLSCSQKHELAGVRGELLHFAVAEDALAVLGDGGGRSDMMRWNIPKLSTKILIEKMLVVFENRRELREDQMYSVPVTEVMSLDWCYHTGKQVGTAIGPLPHLLVMRMQAMSNCA